MKVIVRRHFRRHPRSVLGVERDASQKEIKSAYRKRAKELHPDVTGGDKEKEEELKQVNLAYEALTGAVAILPGATTPGGPRPTVVQNAPPKADLVSLIMEYEQGQLDDEATLELFSDLVRTGMAWTLQGSYGRTAASLIEAGYIEARTGKILKYPGQD